MIVFRIYSGTKLVLSSLCQQVIIGSNGSGKSTILKLVARIYDPTEGIILVNGEDIKTLRLADLRRAMAILFQDYTHFPLSVSPTRLCFPYSDSPRPVTTD
jgi:ABC-type multidrug transport system fused ATPase/permease subunit